MVGNQTGLLIIDYIISLYFRISLFLDIFVQDILDSRHFGVDIFVGRHFGSRQNIPEYR